jgi:lipopolysaccharide export system protein LptA
MNLKDGFAALLLASLLAGPVWAQEQGTVEIESNEMEILENNKTAIFRGDVVAKRPNDTIRCQEMLVTYVDAKKADGTISTQVERMDCSGAVSIRTDSQDITGNKAQFFLLKDELIVTGDVKVVQDKTVIRGPQLFVNLKTRHTKMTGGRVKGKFTPQ